MNTETPEKTSAGHTPGPWTVATYKTLNSGDHVIRSPEKGLHDPHPVIASVHKRPGYSANAKLIAAAPELLAVAKETHQFLVALLDVTSKHGLLLAAEPSLAQFNGMGGRLCAAMAKAGAL